jgi:phosphoribosylglycinamide formyltransferase-1
VLAVRIAVLASGAGTILSSLVAHEIEIALVVLDRHCGAEKIAEQAGISCIVLERRDFSPSFDRVAYTEQVLEVLERAEIELLVMAGYGTILGDAIHARYPDRIMNTHPALLPAFKGWHAVKDALDHGVKVTGCTVHLATPAVDEGRILAQVPVLVEDDDTEESLHERIKTVERELYPATIKAYLAEIGSSAEKRNVAR